MLAGYCMGGTMVLPLAARKDVAALVLLAAPWDFWADGRHQARLIEAHLPGLTALIDGLGQLPPDALQAMFAVLDPLLAARKFSAFAALPPASAAARDFVALEDWLNDAVPLTGPVARACLHDWYGTNAPARGNEPVRWTWWRSRAADEKIAGEGIEPGPTSSIRLREHRAIRSLRGKLRWTGNLEKMRSDS